MKKKRDPEKGEMGPNFEGESDNGFELSEEAKLNKEQERHIKRLKGNKMIVSSEPRFSASEEESEESLEDYRKRVTTPDSEEKSTRDTASDVKEKTPPTKSEGEKRAPTTTEKTELDIDITSLVTYLASYGVPLEGTIAELMNKIEKGEKKSPKKDIDISESKLLNLISSYQVSRKDKVRSLLEEIKRRGESFLRKKL